MAHLVRVHPATEEVCAERTELRGCVVIGRHGDLAVDHASVSRRHARVGSNEQGWFVDDLESTNGTFINGMPIQRAALRDADLLRVGPVMFKFVSGVFVPPDDDGGDDPAHDYVAVFEPRRD